MNVYLNSVLCSSTTSLPPIMDMSSSSSSRGTSCKIKQKQKNGRPESFFLINPINKVIQWQFIHGQPNARISTLVCNKTRKKQPKTRPENKAAPRGLRFSKAFGFLEGLIRGKGGGGVVRFAFVPQIPNGLITTGEKFVRTVSIVKMTTGVCNRNSRQCKTSKHATFKTNSNDIYFFGQFSNTIFRNL